MDQYLEKHKVEQILLKKNFAKLFLCASCVAMAKEMVIFALVMSL